MNHLIKKYRYLIIPGLMFLFTATAWADDGKALFDEKCAGCHTIGGGDSGGPDLKGIAAKRPAEWLTRMISAPEKLTAEKDPTQAELVKKYGMEMPNLGVSAEEAGKIVAYLKGSGDGAAPAAAESKPAAKEPELTPAQAKELAAKGAAYFVGKAPFAKGGPPCVSCHGLRYPGVYGGALAADLTDLYAKMGDTGVRGVLKSLSFPVMKRAYADRPLSDEEISAMSALLKDASSRKTDPDNPYPLAGLGFFAACLIAATIYYNRRIR